ncbi:MAG: putative tricarboxylic transport membrane protein [Gammaproteobacteria bacterium]
MPGMVMIFGLMMFAGERRFLLAAAIAISIPLLLYFFFVHIASIPIPLGIFESLRG